MRITVKPEVTQSDLFKFIQGKRQLPFHVSSVDPCPNENIYYSFNAIRNVAQHRITKSYLWISLECDLSHCFENISILCRH